MLTYKTVLMPELDSNPLKPGRLIIRKCVMSRPTLSLSGLILLAMDHALNCEQLKSWGNHNYIRDVLFAFRGMRARLTLGGESSATDDSLSTHPRVPNWTDNICQSSVTELPFAGAD